jgi:hypothetical protein
MVALLAIIAGCSILPAATPASLGQPARERLVIDYLSALERRDGEAIAAMVNPRVDATVDIAAALDQYGGVQLHDTRVSYLDDFGGTYVVATVSGTGDDGTTYEIEVPISRVDDDYYLALGQATPTGSEANPESPAP